MSERTAKWLGIVIVALCLLLGCYTVYQCAFGDICTSIPARGNLSSDRLYCEKVSVLRCAKGCWRSTELQCQPAEG